MKKINNKGFSLIELMVVVAIIGILSAIAIPNFQAFQAKARQGEAKQNLGAYFSAATATRQEYGFFIGNFVANGFRPSGELNYNILVGNGLRAPVNAGAQYLGAPNNAACISTVAGVCNAATAGYETWVALAATANRGAVVPSAATGGGLCVGVSAITDSTFTACAAGRIGTATVDGWRIDQQKVLNNTQSGIL